ncbi:MAG: pilus assembly protein PilM [Candidatus Uhrbacteria bacterium]
MKFSFFKYSAIGIDVSDRSVEVVAIKHLGLKNVLAKKARAILPDGLVVRGRIQDQKNLLATISGFLSKNGLRLTDAKKVVFGLSESQSYVHVFKTKIQSDPDEYGTLVENELARLVPISTEEMVATHTVSQQDKEFATLVAAGADRAVVVEWQDFFSSLGVKNILIAPEIVATVLGLAIIKNDLLVCVVDLGAFSTSLVICDQTNLLATYSFPKAGEFLTKTIMKAAGLTYEQAEKAKQSGGLLSSDKNISDALVFGTQEIIKEIKDFLTYANKQKNLQIKKVLLVGGTCLLGGLIEVLSKQINVPVEIGTTSLVPKAEGATFVEAVGLAISGLKNHVEQKLFFKRIESEKNLKKVSASQTVFNETEKEDEEDEDLRETKKIKKQKIILGIVVVCGIILIGLAFWYRTGGGN